MRAAILLAALSVAGAAGADAAAAHRTGAPAATDGAAAARARPAALRPFSSCPALARYARANAIRTGAVAGIAPRPFLPEPRPLPVEDDRQPPVVAPDSRAGSPASDVSGTNVQEAGVDEPDVVKTDGDHLFAIAGGALHAVDTRADEPRRLGTLPLAAGFGQHELLLHGERALVITQGFGPASGAELGPAITPAAGGPVTILTEVDVRDPAAMRVVRTVTAEGSYAGARLNGATARVVVSTPPQLTATTPAAIRASRLATWLPRGVVTTPRSGRRQARPLVRCTAVRRPRSFSGLGVLTVLTVDMDRGLPWVDADAIMSDAQTVYGSPRSLYVATQRWIAPETTVEDLPAATSTQIHRFEAGAAQQTAYRATGQVPGHLLNQFSLSEHDGDLRVASTETPVWLGGEEQDSESVVTVLREDGGRLQAVGAVRGMGRGERIYSVRFIEDAGFVVTFRQVDPLYALDLSDPAAPRVAGELKIPGYSAYLHPLGDGLLLGVGQDATEQGQTTGTQLSLFDVSDLARPVRLHQRTLGPFASSAAEYDHHAFLYWPPSRLAVLPLDAFGEVDGGGFSGAIGFTIDRTAGIAEAGRLTHPADAGATAPILRSVVVGERLFTLSDAGVQASDLATLAARAWVPLPPRYAGGGPSASPSTA